LDQIQNLEIFSNCFNEAIRIQPPVPFSTPLMMTQDTEAGGLMIRKGDPLLIGIKHLCKNPSEWIQPEKFIPERFDMSSPLSLTPSGQKRNAFSFSPFLGGSRICLGMTFA